MARPAGVPLRALGSRGAVPAAAASLVLCMRAPSPSPPKMMASSTAPRRAAPGSVRLIRCSRWINLDSHEASQPASQPGACG